MDLEIKTLVNGDGYTVTGNTKAGGDLVQNRNDPEDGLMRPEGASGDVGFVRDSASLITGDGDNLSINAPVAASHKPVGT